ncbi:MAG: type IV conjugative transfer system protein TraL [Holosporaceae bacterium]|nr:type IV conjugative transfer system protein TraL [Holosporaceae bacterium]
MSRINSHVILSHIDAPARILIWPANQVLVCAMPFALGMITEHVFGGVVLSVVTAFLFKLIQKRFGKGKIRSMLYWYLPTSLKLVKRGVPPSYVRFWIR